MRKHLYLIVDHPDEDFIGKVRAVNKRYVAGEKNVERPLDKRNLETGETSVERIVGLGYYDFDDQEDYEQRFPEIAQRKLGEIDAEHLENAGLDPEITTE